ncbi:MULTISPECIES: GIY-YIG nuclease family protein [unclassified Streptomyces]|uniref:GIY-YIG nuclease family protein n=1 Tax=unclassified Streptomyces TaxID=2593676 RepID=UPI001487DFCF|nr:MULTISPECIES: GIY-YIG nuclease family protein [unclassified Streptomyces]
MPEPTVRCACGRTMSPDAPRGRGHYRCGCGNRIHLTIPAQRSTQCVGAHRGEPCRLPPAITEPLPLCDDHFTSTGLRRYASWWTRPDDELATLIAIERTRMQLEAMEYEQPFIDHWMREVAERDRQLQQRRTPEGRQRDREQADQEAHGLVYFVRSGTAVKIGKTLNLAQRMRDINAPETELLATEPGYTRRERELHQAFARYRLNGEWFRLTPPLIAYISDLRGAERLRPVSPAPTNIDNPAPTL